MEMMLGEDRVLFCCTRSAGLPCGMRQATSPWRWRMAGSGQSRSGQVTEREGEILESRSLEWKPVSQGGLRRGRADGDNNRHTYL